MTQQLFSIPAVSRHQRALKRAWDLLEAAGVRQPPVDVERLARYVGISRIEYQPFLRADACLVPSESAHVVIVNSGAPRERQRFSIAHEIGHVLLGRGGIKFRGGREPHSQEERLANVIAAEILIPTPALMRVAIGLQPSIETIAAVAERFEASIEPTAIKLGEFYHPYGVSVAYWTDTQGLLRAKWVVGKLPASMTRERPLRDATFGPCAAHVYDMPMTTYESSRGGELDMVCESAPFGRGYRKFVLSVAKPESPLARRN